MNEKYMQKALECAKKAFTEEEIPVGCVIVKNNKIIASAFNKRQSSNLITAHAEILALNKANKKIENKYLTGCDVYVTLEPCMMCASALLQSRVDNIYFGASNPDEGAFSLGNNILFYDKTKYHSKVYGGVCQKECLKLLQDFFKNKRKIAKNKL